MTKDDFLIGGWVSDDEIDENAAEISEFERTQCTVAELSCLVSCAKAIIDVYDGVPLNELISVHKCLHNAYSALNTCKNVNEERISILREKMREIGDEITRTVSNTEEALRNGWLPGLPSSNLLWTSNQLNLTTNYPRSIENLIASCQISLKGPNVSDVFFVRGGELIHAFRTRPGDPREENLGHPVGQKLDGVPSVVAGAMGASTNKRLDVFVRTEERRLGHCLWTSNGGWRWPHDGYVGNHNKKLRNNPSAVDMGGALHVYMQGTDNRLWQAVNTGGDWRFSHQEVGRVDDSPNAIRCWNNSVVVAIKGTDGEAYVTQWIPPSSGQPARWDGWHHMPPHKIFSAPLVYRDKVWIEGLGKYIHFLIFLIDTEDGQKFVAFDTYRAWNTGGWSDVVTENVEVL